MLRPLKSLVKQPVKEIGSLPEDLYEPLSPCFQLFLNTNDLRTVNPEIFELKSFKFLSLFRNDLTQIPDCIEQVVRLEKLNVAANQLKTLPWSIMNLINRGKLKHLIALPNPFIKPDDVLGIERFCEIVDGRPLLRHLQEQATPILVARSYIEYLDSAGYPSRFTPPTKTFSRSLRETALQAYTKTIDVSIESHQFSISDLEQGNLPISKPVLSSLRKAVEARKYGDNICSICSRSFIIPRVQWIEWWDCFPFENVRGQCRKEGYHHFPLPFLRRGCSPACRP